MGLTPWLTLCLRWPAVTRLLLYSHDTAYNGATRSVRCCGPSLCWHWLTSKERFSQLVLPSFLDDTYICSTDTDTLESETQQVLQAFD